MRPTAPPEPSAPAPPAAAPTRWALRNWRLGARLALVVLIPLLALLALGVVRVVDDARRADTAGAARRAVAGDARVATLLARLGDERAAAATWVASGRVGGPAVVTNAVAQTSAAADAVFRDAGDAATTVELPRLAQVLTRADALRADVRSGRADAVDALGRYGEVSAAVLELRRSPVAGLPDPAVTVRAAALPPLGVVADQDAAVGAVVSAGIAAGRLDPTAVDQLRTALLRRSLAAGQYRDAAGPAAPAVSGPAVDVRDLAAQAALARGGAGQPPAIAAGDWSRTSEAVAAADTAASDRLHADLAAATSDLQGSAQRSALVVTALLLLVLVLTGVALLLVTRSVVRPMKLLRRSAVDVADRRLPAAVRELRDGEVPDTTVVPTPIGTREEIGDVARAFDRLQEQALRVASEQAALRTAVTGVFVNLSRRSQSLVERQLRLIEALENSEEDPDALADLFALDHLATRMRRNSENLLVLSGSETSRRTSRPVALVDVLRAAASEVEQYQRVDLGSPVSAELVGRTSGDVVHLLAELLENATTFSAPDTRVEVSTHRRPDGAVVVEVADRGVGMGEDDLADANARLDLPPVADVSASRRMGLFVVGRLAIRHGISVVLRAREDGGVVAETVVPAAAVLGAAPVLPLPRSAEVASSGGRAAPRHAGGAPDAGSPGSGPVGVGGPGAGGAGAGGAGAGGPGAGGPPSTPLPRRAPGVAAQAITAAAGGSAGSGGASLFESSAPGTVARGPATSGAPAGSAPGAPAPTAPGPGHPADGAAADPGRHARGPEALAAVTAGRTARADLASGRFAAPTTASAADATPAPADDAVTDVTPATPSAGAAAPGGTHPAPDARPSPAARPAPESDSLDEAEPDEADDRTAVLGAQADSATEDDAAVLWRRPDADAGAEGGGAPASADATADDVTDPTEAAGGTDLATPPLGFARPPAGPTGAGTGDGAFAPALTGDSLGGPAPAGSGTDPEWTPIFDEVASMWFREPGTADAPASAADWATTLDVGWQVAALTPPDEGVTDAGLPRRRPRAQLLPGSAPVGGAEWGPAPDPPAPRPRRSAEEIRGRLEGHQRGLTDARAARPAPVTPAPGEER